jgi:hypothetical protein
MVMVGHKTIGVNDYRESFYSLFKVFQKLFMVPDTMKYVLTGVSPVNHMIICARILHT